MHIMIFSQDPRIPCGYGSQVSQLAPYLLNAGHEVSIAALEYYAPTIVVSGMKILPIRLNILDAHTDMYYWAKQEKPDLILQIFDAWCIGKQWIIKDYIPVYTYNPIDCEGLPRLFREGCDGSTLNIAMSPHAKKVFDTHGIKPNIYIPHCVDTKFYQPMSRSKALKMLGLSSGSFIFGVIGTNLTARKNITGQLLAFKKFLDKTKAKNCYMYLHTATYETLNTSFDLTYVIDNLGLNGKILLPNQQSYLLRSITLPIMKAIYNSIDVLMMCSMGEGFGIPILEAQACGKPCIVTDFSAMPYTMGLGGIKIKKGEPYCDSGHMAWWQMPNNDEIVEAMIDIYTNKTLRQDLSNKALENAKKYDWEIWIPKWLKILEGQEV